MFTGIVEEIGVVKSVQIRQSVRTIEIEAIKLRQICILVIPSVLMVHV